MSPGRVGGRGAPGRPRRAFGRRTPVSTPTSTPCSASTTVASRASEGGTAPVRVREQAARWRAALAGNATGAAARPCWRSPVAASGRAGAAGAGDAGDAARTRSGPEEIEPALRGSVANHSIRAIAVAPCTVMCSRTGRDRTRMSTQPKPARFAANTPHRLGCRNSRGDASMRGGEVVAISVRSEAVIALRAAIAARGREAMTDGVSVRIDDQTVYEPDALVRCGAERRGCGGDRRSAGRGRDRRLRALASTPDQACSYFRLPSVRHYLVLHAEAASPSIIAATTTEPLQSPCCTMAFLSSIRPD